jgi:N-formylglutamate amidohydrolase
MKKIHRLYGKNKNSLHELCMEMDQMREMTNTTNKEQDRFKKKLIICVEITQKRFEDQHHFVNDRCRKNNLISGIDRHLQRHTLIC